MSNYAHRVNKIPPYLFAEMELKIAEKTRAGKDVINLGIGDPDLPPPDFFTLALQAHAADRDAHFYSSSRGDAGVRKAIAKYFLGRFGVELDPDSQICVVLGGKEGVCESRR
jgi:aspartate/methionine/tyrosine aminotransferase